MSTGGGVLLGAGIQLGASPTEALTNAGLLGYNVFPFGLASVGTLLSGQVGVSLKPGIVFTIPVAKKPYKDASPKVEVSDFRVKIDGCVGESFIRSYATLSRSTAEGEAIVAWYGVTKAV
jgi:hypothetical protein